MWKELILNNYKDKKQTDNKQNYTKKKDDKKSKLNVLYL